MSLELPGTLIPIVIREMGVVFGVIANVGGNARQGTAECVADGARRGMEARRRTVQTVDSSNPRSVASGARLRSCYYYYY